MDMLIHVVLFAVGLVCLIKGGDWFVDGAVAVARKFKLPEILIGATIVSIGTTLPEVMVSSTAALQGTGSMAYGNAIGSIICNTALISAITIACAPGPVDKKSLKTPIIFFFIAAVAFAVVAYVSGNFVRPFGIACIAMFVIYIVTSAKQMKDNPSEEEEEEGEDLNFGKALVMLIAGAAIIAIGANLLVNHGQAIAEALGVPSSVIALTFVALGTSLPELVTAITSLKKGHGALSLGNVIGANLFNIVLVCGASVTLAPFTIPLDATFLGFNSSLILEIPVMFAVMLLMTVPALIKGKLYRWQGIALLCIYAAFVIIQFTMVQQI